MTSVQSLKFRFENQEHTALTQKIGDQLWIHFQGKTFSIPISDQKRRRKNSSAVSNGANQIAAPMPGKITKVLSAVNDQVQVGQVVLVMEAMKMEYTLKAEVNGKIKTISVKVGDQVSLGQTLIEFASTTSSEEKNG